MSQSQPSAISVSELNGHIKSILEGTFPSIWVAGEVSDLSRPRSGHLYFTIKDDHAQMRGVIWRSTAARMQHELKEGEAVLFFGDVEVYHVRGTYQLVVRKVQPQGQGSLQQAFERLKARLADEGLFAAERKRSLPPHPRRIGLVTSPNGAAISDFLEAAANRWKGCEIVVIPVSVQGQGAARQIVNGIRAAQQVSPALDVLVVSRGGGSLEDLWCFNEEPVVRAVAASHIPTVSAVGHEVDVTLCDLAADVRALTPTDGATRVIPDMQMMERSLENLRQRLDRSMRAAIQSRRQTAQALGSRKILQRPHEVIHLRSRMLDEYDARARRAMRAKLSLGRANVATLAAALSALSPLDVLTRGYSITLDDQNQTIDDAAQVQVGDSIRTRLHHGEIESVVKEVKRS